MKSTRGARQVIEEVAHAGPFEPDWASLSSYRAPAWYEDAKFGIFVHWGAYSVPAFGSEWYPRNMYRLGSPEYEHHRATYGPQDKFGYKDFLSMFKAERFDPDEWAALFRQAGAQFVVPVAEHHDGFAMYDSEYSDWTAAKLGPGRDVLGELADALRRQWLVFGASSHRAEHWWFYNGGMAFPSDVSDPRLAGLYGPAQTEAMPPNEAFLEDWLVRTCELVDRYEPQLVWFDWWIEQPVFEPYLRTFAAYYYNRAAQWRRGVAINYKHTAFPEGAAVYDVERGQLAGIHPRLWQADTSVGKTSWGYVEDHSYKTSSSIICDLVDIVSKRGALLLNIGPRADGTIPEPEREILLDIGKWLGTYGDAVYGTSPWRVFGEGPTEVVAGQFHDTERGEFTSEDVRYTAKGATVFAIPMAWPEDGRIRLRSLAARSGLLDAGVVSVTLVGSERAVDWHAETDALVVDVGRAAGAGDPLALRVVTQARQDN